LKPKFALLLLLFAVSVACKKTTYTEIAPSHNGKLIYKLTDDTGKGLPNIEVSLFAYDSSNYIYKVFLDKQLTDASGQINFGDLNPGSYWVKADSPKVNNISYWAQEQVEVLAATTTRKETRVTDFSALLTVIVRPLEEERPLKNIGVMMVPSNKISYPTSTDSYSKIADFKGVTNDAGLITFKISCYKEYLIYLYDLTTKVQFIAPHDVSILFLEKDQKVNQVLRISP